MNSSHTPRRRTSRVLQLGTIAALSIALAGCGKEHSATSTTIAQPTSMRGERYCEVLLVQPKDGKITAEVYNSWPLNECPADQWKELDAATIASEHGAATALLNGPRYWLMDEVAKADRSEVTKASFGGIDMYRQATVDIGPLATATAPYKTHTVDRKATFTFRSGSTVYELHSPDGATYVMQTWSQTIKDDLTESDLSDLSTQLKLPKDWTYAPRKLTADLRIATGKVAAQVVQDDFQNSYSLEPSNK